MICERICGCDGIDLMYLIDNGSLGGAAMDEKRVRGHSV